MKRVFEGEEVDGSLAPQLKKQRPMLGAMRGVMGVQCMQKHLPKLEPFLRRVVQEEVGKALCRFVHSSSPRLPINRIQTSTSKRYRLHFQNTLPQTLFTGSRIEAEGREPVQIVIMDTELSQNISSGPLSSAKIEILVLDGDFGSDDQKEWTEKEFSDVIVREREGKRPLLTGELVITMNNGAGLLGDVAFTDNSSWIRSRKFRLGARIIQSRCSEASVQEAISGAFVVKDHRGELYRKHHPPSLDDEVWRLEKIGKDGAFHKRLADNGINTVQDFLKSFVMDQDKLRSILGTGMSNKIWEATIEHAKECVLDDKNYLYCSGYGVTLLFNSIFQLAGAMIDRCLYTLDDLTSSQKIQVEKLKQIAYENPEQIIELSPVTEPLPRCLPTSNAISVLPQSSFSEAQNYLSASNQDELAAQVGVVRQPPTSYNELKDYLTGQGFLQEHSLSSLQGNNFNMKDFLDMQFGDIPTRDILMPGNIGDNVELDAPNSLSQLPRWDNINEFIHTSGDDSNVDLVPHPTDISGSHVSSSKWAKMVAALKLMAVSKHLASRRDREVEFGYPEIESSMSNMAQR
ncbi:calmodulin-binding protein 60 B-like [Asparagus officinalis]|nr:calmodulin-binding protein 60 B-like [Asparagus officinalis]